MAMQAGCGPDSSLVIFQEKRNNVPTTDMKQRAPLLAWLIFLFLSLVWGSSFILIKRGLEVFTPMQIGALRMSIAAVVMLLFVWPHLLKLPRRTWAAVAVIGVTGNAIPAFLFPLAETRISSAGAGILNALSPLFVLVVGLLFFGFRSSTRQVVGVFIGFLGALLLILAGQGEINLGEHVSYSLLVVVATVGYGLSTNIMKKYLNDTPALVASGAAIFCAALPYSVYLLFFSGVGHTVTSTPSGWTGLGYIFILAVVGTALASALFYRLIQLTDPIFSASVTYFIPIIALGWGLLDREQLRLPQFVGMGIILLGVYLANRKRRDPAPATPLPTHADRPSSGAAPSGHPDHTPSDDRRSVAELAPDLDAG